MSSPSHNQRAALLGELRRFSGLGASLFRAAAARSGTTVTDLQVIDILAGSGPSTAGRLAELTGLTTGAITAMLNRLEQAGLVRRERDPDDGRKVIVRLDPEQRDKHEVGTVFGSIATAWEAIASEYNDEQLAVLLEFLKRSNAAARTEVIRLQAAPAADEGTVTAPLGDLQSGRLVVASGISNLRLRAGEGMAELFRASFEGPVPDVKTKAGVVTIRYPRRLWPLAQSDRAAEVTLSAAIPWQIVIQGGASQVIAQLRGLNLAELELKGGLSMIHLELPEPAATVPIRISGGTSDIMVRRPAGVAARVHLKGWASEFVFDDQTFSAVGNDVRMQSPEYEAATHRYDIVVASSVSMVTITTD